MGALCKRCNHQAESGQTRCPKCGSMLPGNTAALTHGGRRRKAVTANLAKHSDLYDAWAADLGGDAEMSTAQREVLVGAVGAVLIRDAAERYLSSVKASMTSTRVQRAIGTYFTAQDRVLRAAAQLGASDLRWRQRWEQRFGGKVPPEMWQFLNEMRSLQTEETANKE